MPPAEIADPLAATGTHLLGSSIAQLHGWGGGEPVQAEVVRAQSAEMARRAAASAASRGVGMIARGMGRSYGDAAQLAGGLVLEMTSMNAFSLNATEPSMTAQAGATVGALLSALVPAGWVLPVVPGTQHVTVGGAIASDVHGKNHSAAGTFGAHVRELGLLTATGEILHLERDAADRQLLDATIGGMGLTGVILWATIDLVAIDGALLSVDTDRVDSIDGAFEALTAAGGSHRVAWLDLLAADYGRGVVTRAEHASLAGRGPAALATVRSRARVPARWPQGLLRAGTVRAYNELRYRRSPRHERGRGQSFGAHMFPLDALESWPRLYGRRGLLQYQLAVPHGEEATIERVLECLRRTKVPCFLAVLKDLGEANTAPLSFPIAGWTLALDLPRAAEEVIDLLDSCDELVASAGGRVYLTKDARLSPTALEAMYPRLPAWRQVRERIDPDHRWCSDLGLRTGLSNAASA